MKYLVGEMSNGSAKLRDTHPRGIGRCYVERPLAPARGEPWMLDNGVFRTWNANGRNPDTDYSADYARFERRLPEVGRLADAGRGPLFIVVPDRPGCSRSLDVSVAWIERYRRVFMRRIDHWGYWHGREFSRVPLYLAVQDGMTPATLATNPVLEQVSGLFIGGTDDFKTRIDGWAGLAEMAGLKLHYGRCTMSRIDEARRVGCDSADSSHPNRLAGARWERFLQVHDDQCHNDVATDPFRNVRTSKLPPTEWLIGEAS